MRLGRQQRLLVHPLDKAPGLATVRPSIVHQEPHRSHRGVIPVTECVHHRLAERLAVKIRNLGPHQAAHHLMVWVPRLQQRVDPIEHITSGSANGSTFTRGTVPDITWNIAVAVGRERRMASTVPMVSNPATDGQGPSGPSTTRSRALSKSSSSKASSELPALVCRMCRPQPVSGLRIQIGTAPIREPAGRCSHSCAAARDG